MDVAIVTDLAGIDTHAPDYEVEVVGIGKPEVRVVQLLWTQRVQDGAPFLNLEDGGDFAALTQW